jgi:hypothetical protein
MTIATPASPNLLDDGASAFAPTGGGVQTGYGEVAGSAAKYDTGSPAAAWNGVAVLNVTAISTAGGTEAYILALDLSNDPAFGTYVTPASANPLTVGQVVLPVFNVYNQVAYRYIRLRKILSGTAPSITVQAFVLPLSALASLTQGELTQLLAVYAGDWQAAVSNFQAWMSGSATGGPNANGQYPLSDGAGGTVLADCPAALAVMATSLVSVGLFTALGATTVPANVNLISTSGYNATGVGAATYVATTATGLTASLTTAQTANGRWFTLCEDEISPEMFGAIGDGGSHPASGLYASLAALQALYPFAVSLTQEMDWLAWQAALNHGGFIVAPTRTYKMCNSNPASMTPLTVVAGRSWARCASATFDWSAMVAQAATTHEVANYNFASAAGWTNATQYAADKIINATFTGGAATCTDIGSPTQSTFYQFGYQVTLAPGQYVASMTSTSTLGSSYTNGNTQPAFGNINLFSAAPGTGELYGGANLNNLYELPSGASVTQTISFDFELTQTITAWLTFTGYGYLNISITNFDIQPYFANAAIVATRDGAVEHYPIVQPLVGMQMIGPGSSSGVTGILYKSFSNLDGNLVSFDKTTVSSFGIGLRLEDGAYLTEFFDFNTIGCGTGVYYVGGQNSFENFRFYGGGFTNGGIGIANPAGGEFTLYSSAIDYNTQAIVQNSGRIELHGVHAEMNMPVAAGSPLFQCINGGRISWFGGMFLGAGTVGQAPSPPFDMVSAYSTMAFFGTELYNLYSANFGPACSGAGVIHTYGVRWAGNPNIGQISTAIAMDLLGGAGSFEPGGNPAAGADQTGINLIGGIWPQSGTVTGPWTNTDMPATISTAYAHSGTRSLSFAKSRGNSINDEFMILFPVKEGQFVLPSFWYLAPEAVPTDLIGSATGDLYVRMYWVQVIGSDAYSRPILNSVAVEMRGEHDIALNLAGSTVWAQWSYPTPYNTDSTNAAASVSPGAPVWATHFMLLFDTQSLPAMTFYLDDIVANAF